MLKEFKSFIMKGNVLDLAVAVIVGGAFGSIVSSMTNDILMPPLGMLLNGVDFSDLALTLQSAVYDSEGSLVQPAVEIRYGLFVQKILDFVIIAFAIFMILQMVKKLEKKKPAVVVTPPGPSAEEVLLTEIRDLLKERK